MALQENETFIFVDDRKDIIDKMNDFIRLLREFGLLRPNNMFIFINHPGTNIYTHEATDQQCSRNWNEVFGDLTNEQKASPWVLFGICAALSRLKEQGHQEFDQTLKERLKNDIQSIVEKECPERDESWKVEDSKVLTPEELAKELGINEDNLVQQRAEMDKKRNRMSRAQDHYRLLSKGCYGMGSCY